MLKDFRFTPKQDVFTLFAEIPVVSDFGARCEFTGLQLHKSAFKKSATHVVLTYFVVDYVPETLEYVRYVAEKFTVAKTDVAVALGIFKITGLPPTPTFRLSYLGVQFYESCNGNLVALKEMGMMEVRCLV